MLKEMAADDSVAENSFTGMETSPKEMVPVASGRMAADDNLPAEMSNFLDEYRRKRSPDRTPEPMGEGAVRPGIFVVQKHSATRMHYDLRLEWDGVLKSWAVPRGPHPDPAEKRLAMQTEDHPVEYADFEGVIPKGEYGAGPMIVWDRGQWRPVGDPREGVKAGKVLFELRGFKLKGMWSLVRIKGDTGKEWLLIKETGDAHVRRGGASPYDDGSILSGLQVEELLQGDRRAAELRQACERLGAPRGPLLADQVQPMLAESRTDPFDDAAWLFELKYDGFRAIAARDGTRPRILYRRGADATAVFPDLARALLRLPAGRFVADGEIVVLDETGRPVFQRLQKRALLTAPRDVERAALELPATLFLFDLLAFEDFDLRLLPLIERKKLLRRLIPSSGPLRAVDHVEGHGRALFASVRELGLEGIVAKRARSPYRGGRFRDWQKVRTDRVGDFAVVGFTKGEGSRTGFGSVHVAVRKPEGFVYVGKVGGGFSEKELIAARAELDMLRLPKPPCAGPIPGGRGNTWVQPKLVVEVRYREITEDGLLRQPTFIRFRSDKAPEECVAPGDPPPAPVSREVPFSNLEKVFWPEEGYTKRDLIGYYRAISPWLLPYLRDRPVVLTRYPDGIAGKSFFQKDAPEYVPSWIRTARFYSEDSKRDIDFFMCDDVETLLYVINLGTIPLHLWASRMTAPQHPDWCIVDLDPKTAPFADVITLANAVHDLCEEIGLPSFCKTSGQKGLHVLVPLGGQLTHAQSITLAELIAGVVEKQHGEIGTTARHIPSRRGRVYLDCYQNGYGKTIAGPFSARPVAGATVSMPLLWREVNRKLDPRKFTLKTAPARMKRLKEDPLAEVLTLKPDLHAALSRLAGKLS
jgi:bifunctional non-homologous end joining protein LigD